MQPKINYQPLDQLDDFAFDGNFVNMGPLIALAKKYFLPLVTLIVVILTVSAVVAVLIGFPNGLQIFMYAIFVAVAFAAYFSYRKFVQIEKIAWREFAAANNWSMVAEPEVTGLVPGPIARPGHSHKSSEAVNIVINDKQYCVFEHDYKTGYGRDERGYTATVVIMEVSKVLPSMILISHSTSTKLDSGELKEKLKLEGDFNKYYKVFTAPNLEIDDRVILTPDVMQLLDLNSSGINLGTERNKIFVIADSDLRRAGKLPPLLDYCQKLYTQVLQNLPAAQTGSGH